MNQDRELGALLRDGMTAQARQVSADSQLTERIIATAVAAGDIRSTAEPGARRAWQGWLLPAAAAAVVALLISSVVIGTKLLRSDGSKPASQQSSGPLSGGPSVAPTNSPTPGTSSSPAPQPSPTGTVPAGPVPPAGGPVPAGFRAVDLSWVSTEQGWALGTAPCAHAPCTSILRTSDGGVSWVGLHAPPAPLDADAAAVQAGCPDGCISHLRFANPMVGYAFGTTALYLTTDGGDTWLRQPGQSDSLEIGDGNVLRVISQGGCQPGCNYRLQRAAVGSTHWQDVRLPAGGKGTGGNLVRGGSTAVISTYGNPAGGAQNATTVLFISRDGGASWTNRGEPCPRLSSGMAGGETDSHAVTVAPDGSISVLCTPRGGGSAQFTMTSTDGGTHFVRAPASLGAAAEQAFGAASAQVLFVSTDVLYRSSDGGGHWARTGAGKGPGQALFIGFETSTVGRVLTGDARDANSAATVWTTADAGLHWSATGFG